MIVPMGRWVLREACKTLQAWRNDPDLQHLKLSINCSMVEFVESDFARHVIDTVARYDIDASRLAIEITETLLAEESERIVQTFHALKEAGLQIALDDFGTGYSSLSYLKKFPIDILKIDMSFVRRIKTDPRHDEVLKTIILMARKLNAETVAEGVEHSWQKGWLMFNGCDYLQGYLFAPPMKTEAFEAWYNARQKEENE
jgi:EAL domain-containing protein (putative c-di-GMP-specific phosphodiesterase class I)